MRVYYLKDLSTTMDEFVLIRKKFAKYGINLRLLCGDYASYAFLKEDAILTDLRNQLHQTEPISLICDSYGCNLGLLLANNAKVDNMVLIKPEFVRPSKFELCRRTIAILKNGSLSLDKTKRLITYIKTSHMCSREYNLFLSNNIDNLIIKSDCSNMLVDNDWAVGLISNKLNSKVKTK